MQVNYLLVKHYCKQIVYNVMNEIALIFPHQLFKYHPALQKNRPVYLVEEWLFFRQYNFHQQKIILHRSGMKFYEAYLKEQQFSVQYIGSADERNEIRKLIAFLSQQRITSIHIADVVDCWLTKRIRAACKKHSIALTVHASPSFLNTMDEVTDYFNKKKTYFQTDFYIQQRKQRKLLLETGSKPTGGKWTFDTENRVKFPKKEVVPVVHFPAENGYIAEAKEYVQQHFSANYGSVTAPYFFVSTFKEAEDWLHDFIKNRFEKFGMYEDAIVAKENILHHSVLTPMLNTGLLTPQQILDAAINYAKKHTIPLSSLEGFIRQVMGWREFIRIVYEREGSKQRTANYWKFKRKIPASFWTGTTGIAPIDSTIRKVLQTGYCHHIERLMVLGNFMLLCEFDPDEVYKWFMELFIDAYDWVMVPNVYGMTQFADGGLMTTKPYISGSNYLMKMSDYEKGDWQQVWDGLFWRFMHVHRDFFLKNPRLGMLVGTFDKMSEEKRNIHLATAEKYLSNL
jgi:deoxyribodipyrimidine photolyase-related protein